MKSSNYLEVLENKMLPSANKLFQGSSFVFQDDSAPCHRAKCVKDWHQANGIETLDWPGNSPDLNPIENLWAIVKQKVRESRPNSKKELIHAIEAAWNCQVTRDNLKNLVDSMKDRLEAVVANNGGHTKY